MLLKSIEISGFKSFARNIRIDFSFPVTCIVGPNGSGKSNVAEAFRFVLGEQSKKNMRSKGAEDLIWMGSDARPKANRARVSLVFDNSTRIFDYDFDEIILERVIYADGSNEYLINGAKVRLKDVQLLLASVGLGSNSHHIISQGEADKIISASPKERLAIIKDALGLNKYYIQKSDAQRKLEKTEDNIKEVRLQMRELKPHLTYLESEVRKKDKIIETKKALLDAYTNFILNLEAEIKAGKERIKGEYEHLEELQARLGKEIKELRNAQGDDKLTLIDEEEYKLKEKIDEILSESATLERELGKIEGKLYSVKQHSTASKSITVDIEYVLSIKDALRNRDLDQALSLIDKLIEERENKSNVDTSDLEKIKKEIESRLFDLKETEGELKDKLGELKDKRKSEINKKRGAVDVLIKKEKELADIQREKANLDRLKSDIRSLINDKEQMLQDARFELDDLYTYLLQNISAGSSSKKVSRLEIEKLRARLSELGSVSDELVAEYERLKERISFFEKEIEDLRESSSATEDLIMKLEDELSAHLKGGIEKIKNEFGKFFNELFMGGSADIVLVKVQGKEEDEDGVEIRVKIPGKKITSLNALSGGERSLTSIALIFAVSQVSPPPFIILDETDAALDEANSRRYSDILMKLAEKSQLIAITHNRQTMSIAGELYGVTMGNDAVSQVLTVNLEEAEAVAK